MARLRLAKLSDALFFLELRNDPASIANSTTQRAIPILDHFPWYQAMLTNPTYRVYVLMEASGPLGYGRLKGVGKGADVELTICIATDSRRMGYGKQLIAFLCEEAAQAGCASAWAYVKATNVGCCWAFKFNQFVADDDTQPWITYRRSLKGDEC